MLKKNYSTWYNGDSIFETSPTRRLCSMCLIYIEAVRTYEFRFLVVKTIFYERVQRKIKFISSRQLLIFFLLYN